MSDLSEQAKSWLTSKTILGAAITFLSGVLGVVLKLEFPAEFAAQLATDLATMAGAAFTAYGRVKAVKKIK